MPQNSYSGEYRQNIYRTGCEFWQSLSPLEVVGEKRQSCGLRLRSMRAKKHGDQAHAHPMFYDDIPHIFLTAPPLYDAGAIHLGPCAKRLRSEKLTTSSHLTSPLYEFS